MSPRPSRDEGPRIRLVPARRQTALTLHARICRDAGGGASNSFAVVWTMTGHINRGSG